MTFLDSASKSTRWTLFTSYLPAWGILALFETKDTPETHSIRERGGERAWLTRTRSNANNVAIVSRSPHR